jgi:hypothetical protein
MDENYFLFTFIKDYAPAICGILFTMGALIISETGKIFIGSIIYLLADLVYMSYAMIIGDIFGMICLASGLFFGIRTLIKMNIGVFIKNLKREK